MTEKKIAANLRNLKLCHGPVTEEGRERIRAANLRHGFYAEAEEAAMLALGEDPAQFQELLEGFWDEYSPAGIPQEGLVIRLARATWLQNRADRMQEGYAVRQAQDVNKGRRDRLHAQMVRLKIMADTLRLLVQSVEREYYVTRPADLEKMKSLQQDGVLKEMGEIAIALFLQLHPPGAGADGITLEEQCRKAAARMRDIFGLSSDTPPPPGGVKHFRLSPEDAGAAPNGVGATERGDKLYPKITPAEWEARERPRHLLENILKRQVEACEQQRKALLKESVKGPSPYERAAEIAPTHPDARLMRRMQDSNFREIRRVTNLLLKLKRHQRKMEALGENDDDGREALVEGVKQAEKSSF
ncbi:MAG: hypothetical protein ABSF71_15225 [Terriglobia bacterium]|jgi:hypothetical protein